MHKGRKKRFTFIATSAVVLVVIMLLIVKSFQEEIVFFYAPKDLTSQKVQKLANQVIRVGGLVKKDSVQRPNALKVRFIVTDEEGEIKIEYEGLTPDLFREGQGIIAIGKFNADFSLFISSQLLVKHDEKYMPPELKKD